MHYVTNIYRISKAVDADLGVTFINDSYNESVESLGVEVWSEDEVDRKII